MVNSMFLRLQVAPAFDLGLVPVFRESLEVFRRVLSGGVEVFGELLADEWVSWHRSFFSLQQTQLANEINGP
jgi:hypothetical protein